MINSLRNTLRTNKMMISTYDMFKKFYYTHCTNDEKLIRKRFRKNIGREPEFVNPATYNDKLQWLKFNWYDEEAIKCADKYDVREFVKERIGSQYLNELYAVYNSVEEIDIKSLPKSFVLKGTHGSGFNIICEDKNILNWNIEFRKMTRWMKTNYYLENREWIYKDIKPRIVCEKFLFEDDGGLPKDYKFFCFDGIPKFMFLASDRGKGTKFDFYDLDWNKIPVSQYYPNSNYQNPRPVELDEMIELSKKLSKGFPHVRVDFYVNNGNIIFGEMTYFHFSGTKKFIPEKYDQIFGEYIDLSKIINKEYKCKNI